MLYGVMATAVLFSMLVMSTGLVSAYTYKRDGGGNGFDWDAAGSSCDCVLDNGEFYLDVDFSPGDDGGAYACGGMGFTLEKTYYNNGNDWVQSIKDSTAITKDKTDGHVYWWGDAVDYTVEYNYHSDSDEYVDSGTAYRTDWFDYKIEKSYYTYGVGWTDSHEEGDYTTAFDYDAGSGGMT